MLPVKKFFNALLPICVLFFASCHSSLDSANEALRIGDFDRAARQFSKVLDGEPANRDARYGLALAYFGKAESEERNGSHSADSWARALSEFRILSKIDSNVAKEMHSTALFYLSRARIEENPRAKILGLLDESISLDSANDFSWNLKALVLQGMGDTESAQGIFTKILSRNPKFSPAYSNLGNLYWEQGKTEDAWDIWSMGSLEFPENRHLKHWAKVAEDSLKAQELRREGK